MAVGVAVAGLGLLEDGGTGSRELPADAVAWVGEAVVSRSAFESALALVERDGRPGASDQERRRILERLIDEELLLQQGLALGLPRSDRKLRNDIVAAVLDAATASAADAEPPENDLREFYDANRPLFRGPAALKVAQVYVASASRTEAEAAARAARAAGRLRAGEPLAAVRGELGDPPAVELPASLVPQARLRDYVGPAAARTAVGLEVGGISDPHKSADGYRVLVLLERRHDDGGGFEARRKEVLAEYRRRRGEEALRRYLADLRARTGIRRAADLGGDRP